MPATLLKTPPLNPIHESFPVERILGTPQATLPARQHKIIAVLPAYNAEKTLAATLADIPPGAVDELILVDDGSKDRTVELAREMGLTVIVHPQNRGYGGNQKTCYATALEKGADIVVMIHPDYQYDSRVIPHAVGIIELGICDVVLGSRIRSRHEAIDSGMPWWKYIANRALTAFENFALGQNLGDFHSGFRVYRREVLETIAYERNSDDFVFDTQFLVQTVDAGFRLGDIPVPVRYFKEASSINFRRSLKYGITTMTTVGRYWLHRLRLWRSARYQHKRNPKSNRASAAETSAHS
ncbi:glycosyltransferase family 2 protein [Tuwongella immobilis]|uniref:Glycosyltransferase 2-like domain-containing protein n=1 Tax=Tuwongella immobilis TaxID=692036 RepID=A0A6C2YU22_9BACT|nr:glycosyltransferase family 2 protein [Tuwongella immobilis]VIP04382.1 glycosyl transferase family 2 : Glycosyl transferase, group 2 family protein OS=Planctomyces maris DSM 8797 GN=PM8797T_24426 PE=4 SV=1: Glycos_transf_2 [Tuwongella immobilis]VTS06126.1 glycosyl transferase family 2 : Glycosyl transferase, group 2 family protein OS=Planctomyces maris DSM 8797 GN=PM8797T_24426 PE=4 SV=1: Glycos_transf_2 [Tuwongella immobilis]